MDQGRIAVRYAKALFKLGKENQLTEVFKKDLGYIQSILSNSEDLILILESPVVKISEKNKLITVLFKNQVHNHILSFLNLIINHRREAILNDVFRNYFELYRKENKIVSVILTTAIETDTSTKEKICSIIKNSFQTNVELFTKQDNDILGGYILRIDDKQVDYSISGQLKNLYNSLITTNK